MLQSTRQAKRCASSNHFFYVPGYCRLIGLTVTNSTYENLPYEQTQLSHPTSCSFSTATLPSWGNREHFRAELLGSPNRSGPLIPLCHFSSSSSHNLTRKHDQSGQHSSSIPGRRINPHEPASGPIKKILIANRGEIACRIIQTAERLGISTVAVYSDVDKDSLHVQRATESVRLGPALPSETYLVQEKVLGAARMTGAQAIHPGYGFLSENASFAEACSREGLEFIGPRPAAIKAMGDKSASKSLMTSAGVPVVPGYHGADQSEARLLAEAEGIGYPVLIKATQGGGGKGMRIVHSHTDFLPSLHSAQREAQGAFGNATVLVEKYITRPRHIEVQVFGDKHGNAVHLFERDCSVQRRHQKIIEEAPAPCVSDEFRERIGHAAVNAAKAVGYISAGTVEFIVDTATGQFFFMEMNTRLQVEHPVTEYITGLDLVEWQIRVANGEELPLKQPQIQRIGHAFECRVYAENVPRGFLPASGTLWRCRPPQTGPDVRVETGVAEGDSVSSFYDPMIAKLVVRGRDREVALERMRAALAEYQIAGVLTNLPFLRSLASHPAFAAADLDTHFIERFGGDLGVGVGGSMEGDKGRKEAGGGAPTPSVFEQPFVAASVAAVGQCVVDMWQQQERSREAKSSALGSVWSDGSGFRLNHSLKRLITLSHSQVDTPAALPLSPRSHKEPPLLDKEAEVDARVARLLEVTFLSDGGFSVQDCKERTAHHHHHHHHQEQQQEEEPAAAAPPFGDLCPPLILHASLLAWEGSGAEMDIRLSWSGSSSSSSTTSATTKATWSRYTENNHHHTHVWLSGRHHHFTHPIPSFPEEGWEEEEEDKGKGKDRRGERDEAGRGAGVAPMAGRVVKVAVGVGEEVKKGETVLLLEAMKMEHAVKSPISGTVAAVHVQQGQQVADGSVLFQVSQLACP